MHIIDVFKRVQYSLAVSVVGCAKRGEDGVASTCEIINEQHSCEQLNNAPQESGRSRRCVPGTGEEGW